ncbi:tetratricopeptide repeat protein, partial [bacterium]|nr:tetratricopeptide repeat protein [bacterium]
AWSVLAARGVEEEDAGALRDHASLLLDMERLEEAVAVARRTVDLLAARHGPEHPFTAAASSLLGRILARSGDFDGGIGRIREALAATDRVLGPESREALIGRTNLGQLLMDAGRDDEAIPLLREAEAGARRLLGERHPLRAQLLRSLARAHLARDSVAVAEREFREALSILREANGDSPTLFYPMNDHAAALRRLGRYDEAEPLFVEAISRARPLLGEAHGFLAAMLSNLATTRSDLGRYGEAIAAFEEAVSMAEASFAEGRPEPNRIRSRYGECLLRAGRLGEAERALVKSWEGLQATLGGKHRWSREAAGWLADVAELAGDPAKARLWEERSGA